MSESSDAIPPELRSTIMMIRRAYPHGFDERIKLAILANIQPYMSYRGAAHAMGVVLSLDYVLVYHDVLIAASGRVPPEDVAEARAALECAGFTAWSMEE